MKSLLLPVFTDNVLGLGKEEKPMSLVEGVGVAGNEPGKEEKYLGKYCRLRSGPEVIKLFYSQLC